MARGIGGVQKPLLSSPREGASFPVGRLEATDRARIPLPQVRPLVLRAKLGEKGTVHDVLKLGGRVDELLREASAKGDGSGPVFVDASEGEGAYQLSGEYKIDGQSVTAEVYVYRGEERVGQVTVPGTKDQLDALAQAVVAEVSKMLKP